MGLWPRARAHFCARPQGGPPRTEPWRALSRGRTWRRLPEGLKVGSRGRWFLGRGAVSPLRLSGGVWTEHCGGWFCVVGGFAQTRGKWTPEMPCTCPARLAPTGLRSVRLQRIQGNSSRLRPAPCQPWPHRALRAPGGGCVPVVTLPAGCGTGGAQASEPVLWRLHPRVPFCATCPLGRVCP